MATIKEIAKECGVSVATVSNILNHKPGASDATRELVLETAKKLDYTPNYVAKNLKTRNTRSIGVIAEDMTIFSIPDIIDGITEYCEKVKYQILLINLRLFKKYNDTYYNREDYFGLVRQEIKKLMAMQVEGIIYVTAHERVMINCIPEELPIPAVMAYGYSKSKRVPSVVVDDETGAYEIIRHMIDNGHKRIGVITGKTDSLHMQARLVGYQKALRDAGLCYDPEIVFYGDWTRESGYEHAVKLLDTDVTAVFCMNDLMAGGIYDRAEELGIDIPGKLSVAGYDNRELASYYKPPLTTSRLPLHDVGYKSAEVIMDMLGKTNRSQEKEIICQLPCQRIIRQSVGKAR